MKDTTWIEISREALSHNVKQFRDLVGPNVILSCCVKANAYGHGLVESAKVMLEAGADWLDVNALYEAEILRAAGIDTPIYVMGYVSLEELEKASDLDVRLVVYNRETIEKLEAIGKPVKVHLKLETGNNRQGVREEDLPVFLDLFENTKLVQLEGVSTHFANIEDTLDHSFAMEQLARFKEMAAQFDVKIKHCANSAATMLFPKTYFNMVRVGIASYGLWPSNETRVAVEREVDFRIELKPVLTWKTMIAQVKDVPAGEYISYGCTAKMSRDSKIAVLPVGYYDGYDRGLSNQSYVLIDGQRAPLRGRVCMNMVMVDVTDIPGVKVEDEVVLLGSQGDENLSAEQMGSFIGTINYEISTRINERIPRIVV